MAAFVWACEQFHRAACRVDLRMRMRRPAAAAFSLAAVARGRTTAHPACAVGRGFGRISLKVAIDARTRSERHACVASREEWN